MQPDPQLIQNSQSKTFKIDSVLIFNETEGHVVDFAGTRIWTREAGGIITSDSSPFYSRISNINDTVLTVNGTEYGKAEFKKEDVAGWKTLLKYMKGIPFTNAIAQLILNQLSNEEKEAIAACDTLTELPDTTKATILRTLNGLLDSLGLYQRHRTAIKNDLFILHYIDSLNKEVDRLVAKTAFLDTSGTVNPECSQSLREDIRWFNWTIFIRYLDNEDNAVDFGKIFKRYPSSGRVYSMLFQQGSSQSTLREQEILRFIMINASGTTQLAYKDKYGFNTPAKTSVSSFPFMCDTSWTATQLFWWPDIPFVDSKDIASLVLPGTAVLKYKGFVTDTVTIDSIWSYDLKLYYPLGGELLQNGKPVRIIGALTVSVGFQRTLEIGEFFEFEGNLTSWNMETEVQATDVNGIITKYREHCYLNVNDSKQ